VLERLKTDLHKATIKVRSHSLFCCWLLSDSSNAACVLIYFFPFGQDSLSSQFGFFKLYHSMESFDVGNLDSCDGLIPLWIL